MKSPFLRDVTVAIVGTNEPSREGELFEQCLAEHDVDSLHVDIADLLAQITDRNMTLADAARTNPTGDDVDIEAFKLHPDSPLNMVSGALDVAPSEGPYGLWAMKILERHGVRQPNTSRALLLTKDKWWSYLTLEEMGIATPKSMLLSNASDFETVARSLRFPLVVKDPFSSQGAGVRLARDMDELATVTAALGLGVKSLLVQQYIECGSRDRRIVVVDGAVVDAHDRIATVPGEFRANPALGSAMQRRDAEEDEVDLALRTASALGLRCAGMDISRVTEVLPGREYLPEGSAFVIEANGSPGFHPTDRGPAAIVDSLLRNL
jgi:RimK family alpha-L-glutamate ligase